MGWLDIDDVLAELGLDAADERLPLDVAAAEKQVADWRGDILDWQPVKVTEPAVYRGAVMYASLLYESRNTPEGFAGFDDAGGVLIPDHTKVTTVRRLVRAGKPLVG